MSEDLREAMLEMMSTLCSGIVALNTTADELIRSANILEDEPVSEVLRGHAQRHRVKILEMQGRLAALSARYAARFHPEL